MAKCPNCGGKLTGKPNFCVYCGTNLKTGEKSIASELEGISRSKANKSNYEDRYSSSPSSFAGGFNTGEIAEEPVNNYYQPNQSNEFETNILTDETDIAKATAPVQTIAEVKQELPAPGTYINNSSVKNDEESAVNDIEAAFANLGSQNTAPAAVENDEESAVNDIEEAFANLGSKNTAPAAVENDEESAVNDVEEAFANLGNQNTAPAAVENDEESAVNDVEEAFANQDNQNTVPEVAEETPVITSPAEESAMVRVVSCVGIDVKTAEFMISRAGLKAEIVTRNDDTAAKGEVMEQSHEAGSMVPADTVIKLIVSCGTWSEWSENEPDSSMNEVETVTKYRTRTREKTIDHKTSTTSEYMQGYTLTDSRKGYGDWVTEPYFTNVPRKTSESCEIAENLIGFKYCGWFYRGTSAIERNACCSLEMALYFNNDTKAEDWQYLETISYNNVRETVVAWSPISEIEVSETPAGDKVKSNIHMVAYKVDNTDYPLKYGSFETQWYKYKTRSVSGLTYYFEKEIYTDWSDWSDWNDESQVATEFMEVETKVLYRYRAIADEK